MKTMAVIPCLIAPVLLAACGSSGTSTAPTSAVAAPPTSAPSAAASPAVAAVPMPTSSPTGALTCANFDLAAAHLVTYAHYASLNVGTNNDTVPSFADMNESMGILTAMAPECAPDATAAIAALGTAAGEAAAAYRPGDDPAAIAGDKAALEALKKAGVEAWTSMGKDTGPWESALRFVE